MTGPILEDIATEKFPLVILGKAAKKHVPHLVQISLASIVKKKMYMSKVYTEENTLGWVSQIITLKGHFCGVMEHLLTSITGRKINQTTSTIRTVFILLVYFIKTSTDGMMSIARTVTNSLARKVHFYSELCFSTHTLI